MENIMLTVCGYIVCGFLGILCLIILWFIWTDKINLCGVLAEANGQASMSRLQLLIFTFVIGISFFELVEKYGRFPDMNQGVLTLLGISASTYAVGKGISYSRDEGVSSPKERSEKHSADLAAHASQPSVVVAPQAVVVNPPPPGEQI